MEPPPSKLRYEPMLPLNSDVMKANPFIRTSIQHYRKFALRDHEQKVEKYKRWKQRIFSSRSRKTVRIKKSTPSKSPNSLAAKSLLTKLKAGAENEVHTLQRSKKELEPIFETAERTDMRVAFWLNQYPDKVLSRKDGGGLSFEYLENNNKVLKRKRLLAAKQKKIVKPKKSLRPTTAPAKQSNTAKLPTAVERAEMADRVARERYRETPSWIRRGSLLRKGAIERSLEDEISAGAAAAAATIAAIAVTAIRGLPEKADEAAKNVGKNMHPAGYFRPFFLGRVLPNFGAEFESLASHVHHMKKSRLRTQLLEVKNGISKSVISLAMEKELSGKPCFLLSMFLQKSPYVTALDVSMCNLSAEDMKALMEGTLNSGITNLNLSGNPLGLLRNVNMKVMDEKKEEEGEESSHKLIEESSQTLEEKSKIFSVANIKLDDPMFSKFIKKQITPAADAAVEIMKVMVAGISLISLNLSRCNLQPSAGKLKLLRMTKQNEEIVAESRRKKLQKFRMERDRKRREKERKAFAWEERQRSRRPSTAPAVSKNLEYSKFEQSEENAREEQEEALALGVSGFEDAFEWRSAPNECSVIMMLRSIGCAFSLTDINLSNNRLFDVQEAADALSEALVHSYVLRRLSIRNTKLNVKSALTISKVIPKTTCLQILDVSNNPAFWKESVSIQWIESCLYCDTMQRLIFQNCRMKETTARAIAIHMSRIRRDGNLPRLEVDIEGNGLKQHICQLFFRAMLRSSEVEDIARDIAAECALCSLRGAKDALKAAIVAKEYVDICRIEGETAAEAERRFQLLQLQRQREEAKAAFPPPPSIVVRELDTGNPEDPEQHFLFYFEWESKRLYYNAIVEEEGYSFECTEKKKRSVMIGIDVIDTEKSLKRLEQKQKNKNKSRGRVGEPPPELDRSIYKVGMKIEARYKSRLSWLPGKISYMRIDGTCDIKFENGKTEFSVLQDMIRIPKQDGIEIYISKESSLEERMTYFWAILADRISVESRDQDGKALDVKTKHSIVVSLPEDNKGFGGWLEYKHINSGIHFYYNSLTGKGQWNEPEQVKLWRNRKQSRKEAAQRAKQRKRERKMAVRRERKALRLAMSAKAKEEEMNRKQIEAELKEKNKRWFTIQKKSSDAKDEKETRKQQSTASIKLPFLKLWSIKSRSRKTMFQARTLSKQKEELKDALGFFVKKPTADDLFEFNIHSRKMNEAKEKEEQRVFGPTGDELLAQEEVEKLRSNKPYFSFFSKRVERKIHKLEKKRQQFLDWREHSEAAGILREIKRLKKISVSAEDLDQQRWLESRQKRVRSDFAKVVRSKARLEKALAIAESTGAISAAAAEVLKEREIEKIQDEYSSEEYSSEEALH
eukprot:g6058.t1